MEEWRDIEGYNGIYQVSNLGRVRSLSSIDKLGHKRIGKIINLHKCKDGYVNVCLHKDGKKKYFRVHRLVAIAFIPNPNNLPEVNHIIDDYEHRSDNRVENLEWCDHKYNCNYGTHNEKISKSVKGKKRPNSTGYKHSQARKIKCLTTNEIFTTMKEAHEKYNINEGHICECCQGKRKSAGKHPITGDKMIWIYIE